MIRGFQEVRKEFKKHEEAVHLPTRGSKYSAGYDFYSPENKANTLKGGIRKRNQACGWI